MLTTHLRSLAHAQCITSGEIPIRLVQKLEIIEVVAAGHVGDEAARDVPRGHETGDVVQPGGDLKVAVVANASLDAEGYMVANLPADRERALRALDPAKGLSSRDTVHEPVVAIDVEFVGTLEVEIASIDAT